MKKHKLLSAVLSVSMLLGSLSLPGAGAAGTRVSVHDPSIFKEQDTYYVFGSHIDAAKSKDLINWKTFTNGYATTNNVEFGNLSENLKKAFAWAGEDLQDCAGGFSVWAPDVIYNPDYINPDGSKGAYLMYFCTSSTYKCSVICYAAAQRAEGPYTFVDTLIYSGFYDTDTYVTSATKNVNRKYTSTNIDELIAAGEVTFNNSWFNKHDFNNQLFPNAIDPTIYYDPSGKMYMTYGSWSGGIFTLEIDPATGRAIHPKTGKTADGRLVDSYFGTQIAGGYGKSGEGPFIEYNAETGYYYLWTTYGGLFSDGGYNMRVSRSKHPMGPFTDPSGKPASLSSNTALDSVGLKVMGNYKFSSLDRAYMACGHCSVLRDDDGQWYLFYHARFDDGTEYHEVRVHPMWFNADGWPVVSPFEYAGDRMAAAGYEESDIAGDYEFINHGNATDGKIIGYKKITLSADGTISGDVTGRWSQAQDSAAAELVIDGAAYKGYFLAAKNEKGTKVMSFTAVGVNNQTIWGAQNTPYTGTERAEKADYANADYDLVYNWDSLGQGESAGLRISGTELLSGVSYYLVNQNSGLAIDLPSGKTDSGTNIQQWDKNGSFAQQWRILAVDDEWCSIRSVADESMAISVAADSAEDGTNVELLPYTGAPNQLFKAVRSGSAYGFVSKCSGGKSALDVFEWSTKNGGDIRQYPYKEFACQLWDVKPVWPTVNDGCYVVRNLNSGLCLRMEGDTLTQGSSGTLQVTRLADGTYTLADGSRLLTVSNAELPLLTGAAPEESLNQRFRLQCNKDGTYSILTERSGGEKCVDIYEMSTEPGATVCEWDYWGGDGQKFVFEPYARMQPAQDPLPGDVDADGDVDALDLVMMQKYLLKAGTLTDPRMGDLDGDGTLDIFDLALMKRILLNR